MFLPSYIIFGLQWEDWVVALAQFFFCATLIPTLRHPTQKPPLVTCASTAAGCWVVVIAVVNLGLWLSAVGVVCVASTWSAIAAQRYQLDAQSSGRPNMPLFKLLDIILMRN